MVRVIGRLDDLACREPAAREQQLADVLTRWSLAANHEWLVEGVRLGEPFLQVSTAAAGSVLAWEIEQLQALGCVAVGPFWVPAPWFRDAARYRRIVRLVAEHVLALPASGEALYVPKARDELEPLLDLWPHVLLLPTTAPLSREALLLARAWPVHPLGVVDRPTWGDGRWCSPAEFFCHDLDHARFKVREDLLARGVVIPDAYQDGSTFDAGRGVHRTIVPAAKPFVDATGWATAAARSASLRTWLAQLAAEPQRELGDAAHWLLFELLHEKSLPIDAIVLDRALATSSHVDKLRRKTAAGFYGTVGPAPQVLASLDAARDLLRRCLQATP